MTKTEKDVSRASFENNYRLPGVMFLGWYPRLFLVYKTEVKTKPNSNLFAHIVSGLYRYFDSLFSDFDFLVLKTSLSDRLFHR